MIVVRDIFQLKFGKAREAISVLQEGQELLRQHGYQVNRIMTDLTGEYYTLVMESTYDDLASYEARLNDSTSNDQWRQVYSRFTPLVKSGRREVFRVVE